MRAIHLLFVALAGASFTLAAAQPSGGQALQPLGSTPAVLLAQSAPVDQLSGSNEHAVLRRRIFLPLRNVPLGEALRRISAVSGVPISFSRGTVPVDRRASLSPDTVTVLEALRSVLSGTGLDVWTSERGHVAIVVQQSGMAAPRRPQGAYTSLTPGTKLSSISTIPMTARQQTGTVTGRITAASTGEPLSGATVTVVGTSHAAITGAAGTYSITGVPAGAQRIQVQRVGYAPRTQTVQVQTGQSATVDFALEPQAVQLEGVVAVGYGTQRRRDVTGAVASVSAEELGKVQVPSVAQALQGRVPGVQVTQNSSAPGGGVSIRIRGSGSLGSTNEPLYVIDGMPISGSDNNDPTGGQGRAGSTNPLAFLNTEDIESIEVLKDASSTAIYGARGTNGVVLITTKKGQPGASRMEFESSIATQRIARTMPLLSGPQFARFANEYVELRGGDAGGVPFPNPAAVQNTDWQDLIYRDAPQQEHSVSVLGGTERTRFAVSANYADQQGIVRKSNFQRYSLRANVSHDVMDWLNIGTNLNVSRMNSSVGLTADAEARAAGSAVQNAMGFLPVLSVLNEAGDYTWNDRDFPQELREFGLTGINYDNPVGVLNEVVDQAEFDRVLGNLYAEFALLEGMSLRLNGGANIVNNTRDEYFTRRSRAGGQGNNGVATSGVVEQSHYLGEAILSYRRTLGEIHDLDFTTGATYENEEQFRRQITNNNFANDITKFFNIGSGTPSGGPRVSSGVEEWTLASYLGRLNYGLKQRYLFTLTGRYDGSSKFGTNNKWGFFPSGAVAWRVSDEPFLAGAEWLNDLKLRVSYGVTGNQEIGTYRSQAQISNDNFSFGNQLVSAYRPGSIANPELRWEKSEQFDVGFDAAFLDNRVTLTFDVYDKVTDDLLLDVPLPYESGFSSALMNLGSVRNRGVELALGADLLDGLDGGIAWRADFNIAANRNKVIEIGDRDQIVGGTIARDISAGGLLVRPGLPMGLFYGYETDGLFRSSADVAAHVGPAGQPIQPGAIPGQVRYIDQNGDGKIDAGDRTVLGHNEPDFTLGFTNDLTWGNFNLYTLLQGSYGNEVFNINLQDIAAQQVSPSRNIYAPRVLDAWTPENPDATWPILAVPTGAGYAGPGSGAASGEIVDLYVEDGSYLRLRNLMLNYDVPAGWADRLMGMATASVFLNAENLFTITNYRGFNPDVNTQGQDNINRGIDLGGYPLARVYRIGVRLGF